MSPARTWRITGTLVAIAFLFLGIGVWIGMGL